MDEQKMALIKKSNNIEAINVIQDYCNL